MTTTHPSPTAGATQNERILTALESGEWVAMPELCRASGSYNVHSRISDLRKAGHNIEHRQKRDGRTVCSEYRICTQPPKSVYHPYESAGPTVRK